MALGALEQLVPAGSTRFREVELPVFGIEIGV
jgi:hypothetical protein